MVSAYSGKLKRIEDQNKMNNITAITKRDIFDLFLNGYTEDVLFSREQIFYRYYGRLTEIEFLKKLYSLDKMPSCDSQFENAEGDIWQHTKNNSDWDFGWIFNDDRFGLLNGGDVVLLDFLCAVFHPENRFEKGYWESYLKKINGLIRVDGYELYESDKISGRAIYAWRKITSEESVSGKFIPFSVRNKRAIESKVIILPSISKKIRSAFWNLFNQYDETQNRRDETNWNYSITTIEAVFEDISAYYIPKAFDSTENYSKSTDLEQFFMNNYPYCVFDTIELFARYNSYNNFADEANLLFQQSGLSYKLLGGKVDVSSINPQIKTVIQEVGLKELIEQATSLYHSGSISDRQIAVEKLWDAFERLKSYYGSGKQKKASFEKIIADVAKKDQNYIELFNKEFVELTTIGNNYRIRHHETDKIEVIDNNYYDYFFLRCFALVDLSIKYLK